MCWFYLYNLTLEPIPTSTKLHADGIEASEVNNLFCPSEPPYRYFVENPETNHSIYLSNWFYSDSEVTVIVVITEANQSFWYTDSTVMPTILIPSNHSSSDGTVTPKVYPWSPAHKWPSVTMESHMTVAY